MCVEAGRFVRKMSGGSQAHLIESTDGRFYIVKFSNNPQHPRILINEWITSMILRHLGISTPDAVVVNISPDFIYNNPEVHLQLGSHRLPPTCGSHFGSRSPEGQSDVYDFLPKTILRRVVNVSDFCGALVVDKWLGNMDFRQAIFVRAPGVHSPHLFEAQMIDNGHVFDGGHWRFVDSPLRGPYFDGVYDQVQSLEAFWPWLTPVTTFPEGVLTEAFQQMPSSWRGTDTEEAFEKLLNQLMRRRRHVSDLIRACRAQPSNPFPNWRVESRT